MEVDRQCPEDPCSQIDLNVLVEMPRWWGRGGTSGRRRIDGIAASALWLSQVWKRPFYFVCPSLTLGSPT